MALLGVASVGLPGAQGQPASAQVRVGYLSMAAQGSDASWLAALRDGLRELGHPESPDFAIEVRHAAQRPERVPTLVAELLALNVRLIVTYGTQHIARPLVGATPIVFLADPDPVGTGLVDSLARPGGTITGLTDAHADLAPKRLTFLKEAVPGLARVAILYNPQMAHALRQFRAVESLAPKLGLTLIGRDVAHSGQVAAAFAAIMAAQPDALLMIPDPSWAGEATRQQLVELTLRHRLPTIGTVRENAAAGILLAYGTSFHDLWRRAAVYVDKILKGARPADLPVEEPTRFNLVVNTRTAKTLGLDLPPLLLARADEVIE